MKNIVKLILLAIVLAKLISVQSVHASDKIKIINEPLQKIDGAYRIYRTDNTWNQLLLDTRNGIMWQIAYGIEEQATRARIPINEKPLANGKNAFVGRFTLYPTDNIWTFLLLDQVDGRVWQCQFGTEAGRQMILALEDLKTK